MDRVRLIHWKAAEAAERAERIRPLGYTVDHEEPAGPGFLRELAADPPVAIVIDLSRLPSQGRDFGVLLRKRAGTRHVPLVFVGGVPEKVERVRGLLPDAAYTSWEGIGEALSEAIRMPVVDPVVPGSSFAGYAGKPLTVKLGIKAGMAVGLVHAPDGISGVLEDLPEGARICGGMGPECELCIWFATSHKELDHDLDAILEAARQGPVWIAWPKRSSGVASDLTQQRVRDAGLGAGLVDYKICSINRVWSGLLFTRRDGA